MDDKLKRRVAIITGGSKGIGRDIALSLASEDINVVICARDSKALAKVKDEINQCGGNAMAIVADVMDEDAVKNVISKTIEFFGGLDILVNNAGGAINFGGLDDLTNTEWLNSFQLNVMSIVYFVRHTTCWLKKSTAPRIINISSISGIQPGRYNPHYTTAKAAVINLSKYLANSFAEDHILVNAVCPGPVYSEAWDKNVERVANIENMSITDAKKMVDKIEAAKIPLGFIGDGADVAGLVAFLASDKARWITGSCFHINGGKLQTMN